MKRRDFLGMGFAPIAAAVPAHAANQSEQPMSRPARAGWFPNVPLVTHQGKEVRFYDDLIRGKIVMLNFFVVACADGLCPTMTANLRQVQNLLGARMGRDIFFYSITLRPEQDTPKALRHYAAHFDVGPGWTFLTGKPADIERLRRAQGFVDPDPVKDKDVNSHTAMARYGDDRLERWGTIALRSSPDNIASVFEWLSI